MDSEKFVYWLQGFVELNPNAMLTLTQWQIVKDHLALVFKKETPNRNVGTPFPGYPRQPSDRVLDVPFTKLPWQAPGTQWPPGTIIC